MQLRCVAPPISVVEKHPTEGLRGRSRGVRAPGRWRTEGTMPQLLPDWHFLRPAGRLIWFSVILVIMMIPIIIGAAEAEVRQADDVGPGDGRLGVRLRAVPARLRDHPARVHHLLPTSTCQWGKDKYVIKSTTAIPGISSFNWPVSIDMQAVRDVAVVGIYIVFFGANIALFVMWQNRKVKTRRRRRGADRGRRALALRSSAEGEGVGAWLATMRTRPCPTSRPTTCSRRSIRAS